MAVHSLWMLPLLRYYCRLGIGYVAFERQHDGPPRMDHVRVTVEDCRLDDMRAKQKTRGSRSGRCSCAGGSRDAGQAVGG